MRYESWLEEVRAALDGINMPMDDWQKAFPFNFEAEHAAGTDSAEAAMKANAFWWEEQQKARPDLFRRRGL